VDQIQTGAQPVALGVGKLRGAANEFTAQYKSQRAFAEISAEPIGCRQEMTIVQSDPSAAPLSDTV
jgi:hypothetical protein